MLLILQTPRDSTVELQTLKHEISHKEASRSPFKTELKKWFTALYPSVGPVFFICSSLRCFNSSITLLFAQVLGGELKSTRLWRAAHSIYCPDPISKGSARGLAGWMDRGGGDWSMEGWKKSWHKCQWGLSDWWFSLVGWGTKQLEHMAACQQARDLGLFLLTPSPADLFIYLPFSRSAEGREQAGLECE